MVIRVLLLDLLCVCRQLEVLIVDMIAKEFFAFASSLLSTLVFEP